MLLTGLHVKSMKQLCMEQWFAEPPAPVLA